MTIENNVPEENAPDTRTDAREALSPSLFPDPAGNEEEEQFRLMTAELIKLMADQGAGFKDTRFEIVNRPDRDDVAWQRIPGGYAVRLCAESGWHWCQAAYQLGYALTHCLIDQTAPDDDAVPWAEELICEAGTLKLMSMLADHWRKTPFGREDPDYEEAVREYIGENLKDRGTGELYRCGDRAALQRLNDRDRFDDRIDESHGLYACMGEGDLKKLAEVRRYAADGLLIHTHFWRRSSGGSRAVDFICRLQERIPGCEIPAGVSVTVDLEDSRPSPEQIRTCGSLIRGLRDLPFEHVVFDFMSAENVRNGKTGLVFFQVCRYEDEDVAAEMRLDTRSGRRMYRLICHEDLAVKYLDELLTNGTVPDPDGWQDITRDVFPGKHDADADPEGPPARDIDMKEVKKMYPCHIWSIEDAGKAYAGFRGDKIRDYGDAVRLRDGRVLHWNHAWDEGERSLVRCAECGGLILMQRSEYHNMYDGPDGYYRDWIPVATTEEGDLKNILMDEGDLEDDPVRHLRGNNGSFFWTQGGEPKPDAPEDLKRRILMKYPIRSLDEIAGADTIP